LSVPLESLPRTCLFEHVFTCVVARQSATRKEIGRCRSMVRESFLLPLRLRLLSLSSAPSRFVSTRHDALHPHYRIVPVSASLCSFLAEENRCLRLDLTLRAELVSKQISRRSLLSPATECPSSLLSQSRTLRECLPSMRSLLSSSPIR
jgi:hypothetical protein